MKAKLADIWYDFVTIMIPVLCFLGLGILGLLGVALVVTVTLGPFAIIAYAIIEVAKILAS